MLSLCIFGSYKILFKNDLNYLKNQGIKIGKIELNRIQKIIENFHFKDN